MDAERRRNSRVQVNYPVTLQSSEETMTGQMKNLSSGGAFIDCEKPLAPGEIFNLSIHMEDRGTSLATKAQVVWSISRGMGVRFLSAGDRGNPSEINKSQEET